MHSHHHPLHPHRDPDRHRLPRPRLRGGQGHPGAYRVRLQRRGDDGAAAPVAGGGVCDSEPAGGSGLHWQARRHRGRDAREAHQARQGDSAEGAASARGHRGLLRDQEGIFLRVHHPPPAGVRARAPQAGRPRPLRQQAPGPGGAAAGGIVPHAVPQGDQGRARLRAEMRGQRQGDQPDVRGEGQDHHAGVEVLPGHGQLGPAGQAGHPRGRVAGAQPPHLRLHALAPAPPQLPHRARGQAR
mmetsp:Transcript_28574/g.54588  ORF Transcript_28574/g.54588 Transcript_28574/m.54588 type:complete len:242 (+) Transcript_28574:882-1607(+)